MWFNETEIYKKSLELTEVVREATSPMPVGYAFLRDQLVEVMGGLDVGVALGVVRPTVRDQGAERAGHVASMLRRFK